jgi:hypothetical protein
VYADVEALLAEWLQTNLGVKTWIDPDLPERWDFNAPLAHIRRTPGSADAALTLDDALIDVDVLAKIADNAREVAELIRRAVRVDLLRHTTAGGAFVQHTGTVTPPVWLPDPSLFRRGATYRVVVHASGL